MSEEKFHLTDEELEEDKEKNTKYEKHKETKEKLKTQTNGEKSINAEENIDPIEKIKKKLKQVNIFEHSKANNNSNNNILYDNLINSINEGDGKPHKYDTIIKEKSEKDESWIKQTFFTKTDYILYLLNFTSFFFYYLGLTPCEKDASECILKRGMVFYYIIGVFSFISSVLYAIYISLTLYKRKYWIHYLYTLPVFYYFISNNTGANTIDHGIYNAIGWFFFLFLFISLYLLFCCLLELIRGKRYKTLVLFLGIIITLIIIFNNLPGFSCDFWDLGLNNTRIHNDKDIYGCELMLPRENKCYLKKFDGVFDFSRIFGHSCQAEDLLNNEKKKLLSGLSYKYFGVSKLDHFGYPITTVNDDRYDVYKMEDLEEFQKIVNRHIIKMDLYNKENYPDEPKPEVEVFFDKNGHGTVKINITKNETLSQERKKIAEGKHSLYNNVLFLYLDSISRNVFQRKLHKTAKFIEQFMPYNLNEQEKKFTTFQFLKYNTLKGITMPNIKPMFYGRGMDQPDGVNLVKYYKEQGYVTGHTGTTCGKEIYSINKIILDQDLDYDNWDHENIALFCDPNYFDAGFSLTRGVTSYIKRCLYGKYGFEYIIEYTKQFWELYKDNKKFFRIHFNEGHEGSMEVINYMTDPFFEFVKYFFENNLLNDTFIFLVSDHGCGLFGPWAVFRPDDWVLERTLAPLYLIIPNNEKLYKNGLYDIIHKNQQTFVTPYDIHNTLIQIAYGTDEHDPNIYATRGTSLLLDINPKERYCENPDLDLHLDKNDCKCRKYKN